MIYIPSHLSSASSEKKEKGKKKKRNLQQQKSTLPTSLPSKSPRLSKERNTITFREATRKARKSSGSSCWLASGSWPADSAINLLLHLLSLEHVQRPRDLELVVILRSTPVQRNNRAKELLRLPWNNPFSFSKRREG